MKIPPINSIMCSGLKSEIAANDEIGRDLWNAYQTEISLLTNGTGDYRNKISNVTRRAKQLLINDISSLSLMDKKKYCVKNTTELQELLKGHIQALDNVEGFTNSGKINWNNNFYSNYVPHLGYLR